MMIVLDKIKAFFKWYAEATGPLEPKQETKGEKKAAEPPEAKVAEAPEKKENESYSK